MAHLVSLFKLRVPLGGQEIELQQIDFDAPAAGADAPGAAMKLLRTRIRENSRFTVFDVDPISAERWAEAMLAWARAQPRG